MISRRCSGTLRRCPRRSLRSIACRMKSAPGECWSGCRRLPAAGSGCTRFTNFRTGAGRCTPQRFWRSGESHSTARLRNFPASSCTNCFISCGLVREIRGAGGMRTCCVRNWQRGRGASWDGPRNGESGRFPRRRCAGVAASGGITAARAFAIRPHGCIPARPGTRNSRSRHAGDGSAKPGSGGNWAAGLCRYN